MRKYLLATHGEMAKGLQSTLRLLAGERDNIEFLSFYCDKGDTVEELKVFFEKNKEYEIVVFTDLLGGSVNKEVLNYIGNRVHVIAGFNLAVVLEIILSGDEVIESSQLQKIIESSRQQLVYVNEMIKGSI